MLLSTGGSIYSSLYMLFSLAGQSVCHRSNKLGFNNEDGPNDTAQYIKPSLVWPLPALELHLLLSSTWTLGFIYSQLSMGAMCFMHFSHAAFFCLKYAFFLLCPEKSYSFFKLQFKRLLLCEAVFYPPQPQKIWLCPLVCHPYAHPNFYYRSQPHWFTIVYFHIPLLVCSFSHHLLRTLEARGQNFFMFVSQHSIWRSLMYSSNLLAIIECLACLRDYIRKLEQGEGLPWPHREWCVMRLERGSQGTAIAHGRPCQPWHRSGD